jgi:hypothetical protein
MVGRDRELRELTRLAPSRRRAIGNRRENAAGGQWRPGRASPVTCRRRCYTPVADARGGMGVTSAATQTASGSTVVVRRIAV